MVQPLSNSSAMATWPETRTISGVRPTQIGYRPWSQLNSSAFCTDGIARVSDWYMWWCVLIRPGTTTWRRASITSWTCVSSSSTFSLARMMRSMRPSRIKSEASCTSVFASSIVAMQRARWISNVVMDLSLARCETSRGRIPWPPCKGGGRAPRCRASRAVQWGDFTQTPSALF